MESKYYVVCGTRAEFDRFIRKKMADLYTPTNNLTLSHFVYVDSVDRIRGVSNPTGWFYGTWYMKVDIREILAVLLSCSTNDVKKYDSIMSMHDRLNEIEAMENHYK